MSAGQLARHRSSSSAGTRPSVRSQAAVVPRPRSVNGDFQPCAATASIFLFAQGSRILCLHHDTLAIERRFERHKEPVVLLSVDNVSERGSGRLVVSYDAGQTAIVWDLFSGDEIARFASYETLKVAAWMRDGNVAFGNMQGNVILFEPSTSEHTSARTIYDPITALAPASDCQTYAIGYKNGSILIVTLQPSFNILHTLSTSRSPSPIIGLAWHASSTKQKSDMLAVQSADGDLRVWSIAKPPVKDSPKVIRVLKRGDSVESGANWIAWSKNGRILQYSQGETWSWDVRTKHVAYEPIPTVDGVLGLANYGPTATLFTLGPNHSIQQYDLSPPALTKSVRYDPAFNPSQQPVPAQLTPKMNPHHIPGAAPPIARYNKTSTNQASRGPASLQTIQRAANEMQAVEHARQLRTGMASPMSTASRTESISSRSSIGDRNRNYAPSESSRAASGTTFSTFSPSMAGRDSYSGIGSTYFPHTASVASSGRRSKGSRLRQEVLLSPEDHLLDLFPYTRSRLASLPYSPQPPQALDQSKASAGDLRRQMLQIVFGWDDDIEPMIRDELSNHPAGSMNATLLSKWLGEVRIDSMAALMSETPLSSTDWMLLAISQMNGQGTASKQLGHNFVQRLLQQGDIHTAATILLGMGDREDAVEIYVSRNYYMEGILLACLLFPDEWQRQAHLVRRWGEYVVENSQQHLAIRCFSCTGVETSMAWASPTQSPFTGNQPQSQLPQIISPPTSPPPQANKHTTAPRITTKNASLKLITTFGDNPAKFNFPGLISEDHTPTIAPGITPIAESALSPGGTPSTYQRPHLRSRHKEPKTPGIYSRNRLPSIGETPVDSIPPPFSSPRPNALPTPNDSGSEPERDDHSAIRTQEATVIPSTVEEAPLTLSSERYDPSAGDQTPLQTPQTALPSTAVRTTLPSNSEKFHALQQRESSRTRNGSRDRKPDGLKIQMPSKDQLRFHAYTGSESAQSARDHRRSNTWSSLHSNGSLSSANSLSRADLISPPATGQSWTSSIKSPSVSGRSMDQYISSLDEAQFYSGKSNDPRRAHRSRERRSHAHGKHKSSRSQTRRREPSEDRGRAGPKYIRPAKRSPSSPVPMSPQDLEKYRDAHSQSIVSTLSLSRGSSPEAPLTHSRGQSSRRKGSSKSRAISKASEYSHRTVRRVSPDGCLDSRMGSEASYDDRSQMTSRIASPDNLLSPYRRGRSQSEHRGSSVRSPSSPLPMSPERRYSGDENGPLRLVEANRERLRSSHRSSSRRPRERGSSGRRERSPDRRMTSEQRPLYKSQTFDQSATEPTTDQKTSDGEKLSSDSNAPPLRHTKSQRALKREKAARELAARRESLLVRAAEVGNIPHPSSLSAQRPYLGRSQTDLSNSPTSSAWSHVGSPNLQNGGMSDAVKPHEMSPEFRSASTGPQGLPSTPRAMRHPRYQGRDDDIPAVPELPDSFYTTIRDLPRSMSAPIPEPDVPLPTDMPTHPAFHRGLRPSNKRSNFAPLGDIGKTNSRRTPSMDAPMLGSPPLSTSIDGRIRRSHDGDAIIVVPDTSAYPPLLPELQHLAQPPPPPPPPPPPHPAFRHDDLTHHSISSGSGVGTINIVMDDLSRAGTPTIDVSAIAVPAHAHDRVKSPPPPPPPPSQLQPPGMVGSPPLDSAGHRRGRSVHDFSGKFKGFSERMRSSSRGRAGLTKSPKPVHEELGMGRLGPSPYESLPEFF